MKSTQFTLSVTNATDKQIKEIESLMKKTALDYDSDLFEPQCDGEIVFTETFNV